MTSKQRSYLKGLAMTMDAVLQIGKSSLTPEITKSVEEALNARELIKIHVLKNCADDGKRPCADPCRAHPFRGCTGHRKDDRSV